MLKRILKEIDENFDVEQVMGDYVITYNGGHFETVSMQVLTREKIEDIRHTLWLNRRGEILDYVDEQNEKRDASIDRQQSNMAEALAKEMRRPLIDNYLYGR